MISGKKIYLRAIELDDAELLKELMNNSKISGYVIGRSELVSLGSQKDWILSMSSNSNTYRLIIVDSQSNEPIGVTGLWNIDWKNQSAESAIKLLPKTAKKGIGTEAIMLTMAWAFYSVGLRRLYASILDFNVSSLTLYNKKCKWRIEGCEKQSIFRKGHWRDVYNLAILKNEFDALKQSEEYINLVCPFDTSARIEFQA